MNVFILDEKAKESLFTLRKHAEEHPFTMEMLEEIVAGKREIPGDTEEFSRYLQGGQKVVLTIEHQDAGNLRHMSMSNIRKGTMPSPLEVEITMEHLGFKNKLYGCRLDLEEIVPGHHAISIIEILDES